LVVEGSNSGKVGVDAEDFVECISLGTGLDRGSRCSGLGLCASVLRSLVSATGVHQLVTHRAGDDINVLRRPLGERCLVAGLEASLPTSIDASGELNPRNAALAEVANAALVVSSIIISGVVSSVVVVVPGVGVSVVALVTVVTCVAVISSIAFVAIVSSVAIVAIISSVAVAVASLCATAEGRSVRLTALLHSRAFGRIEEQVGVVGGILSLNQAVELWVLGGLLTEDRVARCRGVGGEIRRGVLLRLAVLFGDRDHLGLGSGIKLLAGIDDRVSEILLGTLRLSSQEWGDSLTRQDATHLSGAGVSEFLEDSRLFLTKPTGVKIDGAVISLKDPLASDNGLHSSKDRECNKSNAGLCEHLEALKGLK